MIRTWAADITSLFQEACYRQYYSGAPQFRKEKADKLKHMQKKAQSIGVWSLYEKMKHYYALSGNESYNFSHSGKYVLCSVCTGADCFDGEVRVGCDVEKMNGCRLKVAKHFFCESEYRCIAETEEKGGKQEEAFYRYWVLKESFMKAVRKGMALAPDSFEVRLGNPSKLIRQPEAYQESFFYMESELGDGTYRVAVCSTDKEIDAEVRVIQLEI